MKRLFALLLLLSFAAPALAQAPYYPPRITEHRTAPPIKKTQGPQFGLLNIGVGGGFRGRLESQQREIDQLRQQLQQQPLQSPGPSYDPAVAGELRRIGDLLQQQILFQQGQRPLTPVPEPIAQAPAPINIYIPRQELPIAGAPKQELPIAGEPKQQLPIAGEPKQQLPIEGQPKQELPVPGAPKQELPPGGVIKQEIQIPLSPGPRQELPQQPAPRQELGPPTGYQRFTVDRRPVWTPVYYPSTPRAQSSPAMKVYDRRYNQ